MIPFQTDSASTQQGLIKSFLVKDIYSMSDSISYNHSIHGENPMKSKLASRNAQWQILRHLLAKAGIDGPLEYDMAGKPMLSHGPHISVTHSGKAMLLSYSNRNHGVDMEVKGTKASKIKQRFCNERELAWAERVNDENIYTLLWCAKEAIFKYFGTDVDFREDIFIEPTEADSPIVHATYDGVHGKKKFLGEISHHDELCVIHALCLD